MKPIELLYAVNIISRKYKSIRQQLMFFMLLEHYDSHKQIDIIWCGEDGIWQTLPANYHSRIEPNLEYWQAQLQIRLTATQSLPGNIRFAVRYRYLGQEYWDNNHDLNYVIEADSGIKLFNGRLIQNIGFSEQRRKNQSFCRLQSPSTNLCRPARSLYTGVTTTGEIRTGLIVFYKKPIGTKPT